MSEINKLNLLTDSKTMPVELVSLKICKQGLCAQLMVTNLATSNQIDYKVVSNIDTLSPGNMAYFSFPQTILLRQDCLCRLLSHRDLFLVSHTHTC